MGQPTAQSEMMPDELAHQARTKLINSLVECQMLKKPEITAAFLTIPRHIFVDQFYQQHGGDWHAVQSSHNAAWFETIYSDTALVTQVTRHRPTSSSSQPSLMAQMLEALGVERGQRVLEIGTGTGYNAALLVSLTGTSDLVTTIEIDPELAEKAHSALETLGYNATSVCTCNGLEGYPKNAPYDRIIATASYPYVPESWLDQLVPGGTLVMNVQTPLAGALLKVTKGHKGRSAHGIFLDIPHVMFMPLQPSLTETSPVHTRQGLTELPVVATLSSTREKIDPSLFDHSFAWRFWLHLALPHAFLIWKRQGEKQPLFPVLIDPRMQSVVSFWPVQERGWIIEVRGNLQLWECLQQTYAEWIRHETPSLPQYRFLVDAQGKQWVNLDKMIWILHE
jgi:protein-L-isoaspartate(D-aspartate) O-methyltransferase